MPPKKDAKKGAPVGNYKAGRPLKDILPANSKPPREGQPIKVEGEPDLRRSYTFEPLPEFQEWPGNEEAKNHNFGLQEENAPQFEDNFQFYLPPSFKEFEKVGEICWLRPEEYLREIAYESEMSKRKQEKKSQIQKKKTMRRQSILAMGNTTSIDEVNNTKINADVEEKKNPVNKEDLHVEYQCIQFEMRLETEEEVKKRKEEAERLAAQDKNAKKKPPPKGQPAPDPLDEPQMIRVAVENSMDMGFLMPLYSKWATSQFQFVKDRAIRDVDSRERIWQRIYPQEAGIPTISPSGRYWVKLRFMGKERLIEVDDRMPCDSKRKLMFPRSVNNFEIWPQLLMKALLKVHAYKWYQDNALFDSEVGDGSIVHALTGLVPELVSLKDFERDGIETLRKILSDDFYFNKKIYACCFCDNEFRPKLPSQATTLKKIDFGGGQQTGANVSIDGGSELSSPTLSVQTSSGKMLGRLRDAATLAISVTTGRKLNIPSKSRDSCNVITGFGYALMDFFENHFVDMDAIQKKKDEIEEVKSPFMSQAKKRRVPGLSKDEWRKKRKEERKREQEERERREKEPPRQYVLIKIKTSCGRYPVMNYLSPFTNDEIAEGKKCYLNHIRRPPTPVIPLSPVKSEFKGQTGVFHLNVQALDNNPPAHNADQNEENKEEKAPLVEPKTRAAGGVWLQASDFPHSFQHMLLFHNLNKVGYQEFFRDQWKDTTQPFVPNISEVVVKLEMDQEKYQTQVVASGLQSLDISKPSLNQSHLQDQSLNIEESKIEPGSVKGEEYKMLPGEVLPSMLSMDQVQMMFAPYPTAKPYPVLPRYLLRLQQIDAPSYEEAEEDQDVAPVDLTFKQYLEGKTLTLSLPKSSEHVIWVKPTAIAPLGFSLWLAAPFRKISCISKSDYLVQQKAHHQKTYTVDYLPQEKYKYHLFAKYEFSAPAAQQEDAPPAVLHIKVDMPSDRYLLNFIRLVLIDRHSAGKVTQAESSQTFNQARLERLEVRQNEGKGYLLLVEGAMPYNTTEGQLAMEVLADREGVEMVEVVHTEPVEYVDKYYPSKYGIIFKEKVFVGPEHVSVALNIRLKLDGTDFDSLEAPKRLFKFQVLDQGTVIFEKQGYNQLTLSHFLFRSNQGLPEVGTPDAEEVKHAYVIQATFDLDEWPECKDLSLEGVTWHMKVYSSDTLAIIKDTDKEDRERALKMSWEQAEPGRADKAKRSRQKFLLLEKQRRGEQLSEEDQAALDAIGTRERVRKKDEPEVPAKGKAKAPPAKGKEDKKQAAKAQEVVQKEEDKVKKVLPEPDAHVNSEIRDFLLHFKSDRLIHIGDNQVQARKRTDQEKSSLQEQRNKDIAEAMQDLQAQREEREREKEMRDNDRQELQASIDQNRMQYKEGLQEVMAARNKYREMISLRKDKEKAIQDLLSADKVDLNALQKAVDDCRDSLGRQEIIERGESQLRWLRYCKEVEGSLQQAVQEKNKEGILGIIEKIEKEGIVIEQKMVNDAKSAAAKIK